MPHVDLYNGFRNDSMTPERLQFRNTLTVAGIVVFDFCGLLGPFFVPIDAAELEELKDCDGHYLGRSSSLQGNSSEDELVLELLDEKVKKFFFDDAGEFKFKNCDKRPRLLGNWEVLLIGRLP